MKKNDKKDPNEVNYCYYDIGVIKEVNGLQLKMKHKNVLWALDSIGENIFPSRATIGSMGGCSTQTVDSALKDLVGIDLVKVRLRQGTSSVYLLNRKLLRNSADEIRVPRRLEKERVDREIEETQNAWRIGTHELQEGTYLESR